MTIRTAVRNLPLLSALAVFGCVGGETNPAPPTRVGNGGATRPDGGAPPVPVRRVEPAAPVTKAESGGIPVISGLAKLLGGGSKSGDGSDAAIQGEHTLRLQTFTAAGHEKRAAAWVTKNLTKAGFPKGFIVEQGDQTVVCYGHYPPPQTRPNGGALLLPADMVEDRVALLRRFNNPEAGTYGDTRFDFIPTPVPTVANQYRIEDARGEWTLHWMSVYGEPDSKVKAQQIAEEVRREMKIPCFVVPNEQQFLICVGDLPADALTQEAYAPINAPRYKDRDGRPFLNRRAELNYVARPVSGEAQSIWDRFHDFLVNGRPPSAPAAFRGKDGKNLEPQSMWIRISDLRGRRGSSGFTAEEESFLPGPRR